MRKFLVQGEEAGVSRIGQCFRRLGVRVGWALLGLVVSSGHAQVPGVLSQIGFVQVGGIPFHGEGRFKFAMVDGAPSPATLWSHDGSSLGGGEPGSWIVTDLFHGRYSVSLGDTNVANMTAPIPASAVGSTNVFLRIWFSDGVNGFEQLSPDQPLLSVPYALRAATVSEGAIGSAQLASNAVQGAAILDGTITGADIANGTLTTADFNLANVDVRYVLKAGDAMTGSLSVSSFTAQSGSRVQFRAGTAITLGTGFWARAGSSFRARLAGPLGDPPPPAAFSTGPGASAPAAPTLPESAR